jgi:putative SOS response-associated peptidase YedK
MCGRFTLVTAPDKLLERFMVESILFELFTAFNIAPGQIIPAIIEDKGKRRIGGD